MTPQRIWWAVSILVIVIFAAAGWLWINQKPSFHGTVIDPPIAAAEIQLTDFNGRPFRLSEMRGRIVLLYFGYTHCPDECPLAMARLKETLGRLGDRAAEVQVILVTTDPKRDTPQALREFLGKFNPTFLGLWGTPQELTRVWKDYGVTVMEDGETHSNFIYVIDRAGRLRLTFFPETSPSDAAADLQVLLRERN